MYNQFPRIFFYPFWRQWQHVLSSTYLLLHPFSRISQRKKFHLTLGKFVHCNHSCTKNLQASLDTWLSFICIIILKWPIAYSVLTYCCKSHWIYMVDLCHQGLNFCSGVYCSYFFHLLAFSCRTVRNNSSGLLTGSHGNSSIVSIVTFWFFSKNWTKCHSIELIYFPQKTLDDEAHFTHGLAKLVQGIFPIYVYSLA